MAAMRAVLDPPTPGAITANPLISFENMKQQLLLRIPPELHVRLVAQAKREGRSVNALANELLDLHVEVDPSDLRTSVRARAAALGILHRRPRIGPSLTPEERERAIESTRGLGPVLDQILDEDRNRP